MPLCVKPSDIRSVHPAPWHLQSLPCIMTGLLYQFATSHAESKLDIRSRICNPRTRLILTTLPLLSPFDRLHELASNPCTPSHPVGVAGDSILSWRLLHLFQSPYKSLYIASLPLRICVRIHCPSHIPSQSTVIFWLTILQVQSYASELILGTSSSSTFYTNILYRSFYKAVGPEEYHVNGRKLSESTDVHR